MADKLLTKEEVLALPELKPGTYVINGHKVRVGAKITGKELPKWVEHLFKVEAKTPVK